MEYIKLEEDLRIGFEVSASYFEEELLRALVEFDELLKDNLFIQGVYINGVPKFEDMFERLEDKISILDVINYSKFHSAYVVEDLGYEIFLEDEWVELVGDRTTKEIKRDLLSGKLKELEEILSEIKISELYHSREIIGDMLEENKINLALENMKIVKGYWRGYNQGDYAEYYTVITYNSKEEKEELENKVLDKFNYLAKLLNGDVYDINVTLEEEKKLFRGAGEEEKSIWKVKEIGNYGSVVIDYSNLDNYIKEQAKEITNKKYHKQIEDEKLDINIEWN